MTSTPLIYSIIAPLIIISSVAVYQGKAFTAIETARLLQNCMLIAGIGTLLQLYPIWKIGSGLPVVMGISFTFLAACLATASQDYGIMVGAIIVGGCFEGVLGLTAKYWRKIISPIVSACVVVSIGLSILNVGVSSFGSSSAYPLGSWQNLLVATITLASALSGGVFGCSPITSFSQNVGLISMTHVVNRFTIMFGAPAMILGGLFPPIGAFFTTLPDCVLGGCTVIMFGSIMMSGVRMMHDAGMDQRNTLIAATSICLGVGVTQVDGFFNELPSFIGDIFAGNMVAGVFVVGLILDLCLPRDHSHYTSMWHKFLAYKKAPEKIPQESFLYTTQCTGVSTPKRSLMTWRGQTTAHAPQLRQRAASITAWNCSISEQFFTHRPQPMHPYAHRSAPSSSFFARQPPLQ